MSRDHGLDAALRGAELSVAKIKETLYTQGDIATNFCSESPISRAAPRNNTPAPDSASPYTAQLLSQAKMITLLYQTIERLERDRDLHLQRIQRLEDEVRQLGASRAQDVSESLLERKIGGLRQEVSGDLRRLEDQVRDSSARSPPLRSAASILQELHETKRLIWKECESLRRGSDYVRKKLRQQEDDLLRHTSHAQELKRVTEQNTAVLEKMLNSCEVQTRELERCGADTHTTQRDLLHLRSVIRDLQENVRTLEGKMSAPRKRRHRP
ncbi:hypothetical protein PRIEUP_LOCUS910, partial [Pristimantis euphronides]